MYLRANINSYIKHNQSLIMKNLYILYITAQYINHKYEKLRKSEERKCAREMEVYRKQRKSVRKMSRKEDIDFGANPMWAR